MHRRTRKLLGYKSLWAATAAIAGRPLAQRPLLQSHERAWLGRACWLGVRGAGTTALAFLLLFPFLGQCLLVLPALAQDLKISHQFHATSDARGRAARVFAEEATLRSPELKFSIHPQLSLGLSRDEQLHALQTGKLDFAVFPLVFGVKKIPEFTLALLPGLIPNLATARALKGSEMHAKLQAVAAANGLRIVTWWWMRGGFATTGKEITTPASVQGLKFQSCGSAQVVLAGAGAQIGDEPWEEIALRIEMGALDGVAVPYEDFINLRLHQHAKFGTFGGPSILTCFSPLLMSKKAWDRLTPEQKRSIEEAAEVSDDYFESAQKEVEKRALAAFRKAGAKVRSLTAGEYVGWLQLAQKTAWTDYVKGSPASRDLINTTIRVILLELATKDELIDAMYPADEKQ